LLNAGISVVAINYRLIKSNSELQPPVKAPLYDAARALQFVRSKAKEWNIDKTRIAASGSSAGACSSLWLLYHDDLADPESDDPIARESTRLYCAAVNNAQTSLDPKQLKAWTPNSKYGGHAFGMKSFDQFLAERRKSFPGYRSTLLTPWPVQTIHRFIFTTRVRHQRLGNLRKTRLTHPTLG
jgi:hypothetical protein